jgi:hypothetical protein
MSRRRHRRFIYATGQSLGPPPEVATFTVAPVSQDNRRRAAIEGRYGSTANMAYWALPQNANGSTDYYVWWSHGGYNADPGDHVAVLAGYTGIEVALGSGSITAASRASSTISAINGAGAGLVASGDETGLAISGNIDAATCAVGAAYTGRGTAGLFGSHTTTVVSNGNPFNAVIAAHATFTAGPAVLTAIGILLGTADPADQVRVAVYSGGSSTWSTTPTLVAEGIVTATDDGSGNVYAWLSLTAAQSAAIADNASLWVLAKADQTNGTHPAFETPGSSDLTNRNLVIVNTGIDNDPTVAFPASLAGITDVDETNAVVMMCAIEYRTAPFCSDCSLGGTTTNGLILGMHTDNVLAASESALTSPDAGGANVLASLTTPAILGMLCTRRETALHDISSGQMRTGEYAGGSIGDPDAATLSQDHGATAGSGSMAWVGQNASPEFSIAASSTLHLAIRGNGGVAVGFVAGASPSTASPADDPSDFATGATDEYETNTDNPAHSTDDTVAFETPFATDPQDLQPGNYPGMRLRFRVAGDTVTA